MRDHSTFVKTRQQGDCGDSPINAVYFDGTTTDVPVISAGNLVFKGGKTFTKARGIGYDGPSGIPGNGNWFKIPFDDILLGGSGAVIRACTPSLKKKVRFKCCIVNCAHNSERTAIELKAQSSCESAIWYTWVANKEVFFDCGCMESCCQKLTALKKQFDDDLNSPVTAQVINIGDDWYIDIESKTAGIDFTVVSSEGLTKGDVIIPNFSQNFNAKQMQDWFPEALLGPCAADTCMSAIEIFYWDKVLVRGTAGTTNPLTDNGRYEWIKNQAIIVFNPAVAQSVTAMNATITLLTGTNEYNKRLTSTVAIDFVVYPYCIVRIDAGDEAALTLVRSGYPTAVISLERSLYQDGKSYYQFKSTSGTAPAPVTIGANVDVVNRGYCGSDDLPCNVPTGCPEVESTCLNC